MTQILEHSLAEFILETNYPYKRIIRQTDNSPKYKSKDEFLSNILFTYTLRVTRITRLVFWCWAEEAWQQMINNMAALVNSLTSIFHAWNSFFNVFWISSNISTFEDFFSAKRSSTVAYLTVFTSSVLWIKYNFQEDVCVSVCLSQLCFPFLFLRSSCFTGLHFQIGIPGNPAKL